MLLRPSVIGFFAALISSADLGHAAPPTTHPSDNARKSVSHPPPSAYMIDGNGSVTLRLCFNWSCARKDIMAFTASDMALIKTRIATCSGSSLYDRLQQVRIGIWQMELLAQTHQPLLANDLAINDFEEAVSGRMDCVDNTSNTTTFLNILRDIGGLSGWTVSSPKVRNRFDLTGVHWTAVITDKETGAPWSVDSWYRPHGHLPMVMPLRDWSNEEKPWEPPFEAFNPTPHSIYELCNKEPSDH